MKGQADGDANKKIIVGRIAVRRMGASCTAMEIYVSGTVGSYDTSHEYCIFVPPDLRPYPVQIFPQSLWVCSVSLCLCASVVSGLQRGLYTAVMICMSGGLMSEVGCAVRTACWSWQY